MTTATLPTPTADSLDTALADYLLRRESDPTTLPGAFAAELPDSLHRRFLAEIEALGEIDRLTELPPRDLPHRLGNYRILGRLGEGAMGTVQSLPPGLRDVVARCLERDPTRRYQSAALLASDLRRYAATSRAWVQGWAGQAAGVVRQCRKRWAVAALCLLLPLQLVSTAPTESANLRDALVRLERLEQHVHAAECVAPAPVLRGEQGVMLSALSRRP